MGLCLSEQAAFSQSGEGSNALRLETRPSKTALLVGEPLLIEFAITNTSDKPLTFDCDLDLGGGQLKFFMLRLLPEEVEESNSQPRSFEFVVHYNAIRAPMTLEVGKSITNTHLIVYNHRHNDFPFPEAGKYRMWCVFHNYVGNHEEKIESNKVTITVQEPQAEEAKAFALWKEDRNMALVVQGESKDKNAIAKLQQLSQEYPKSVYSQYAKGALLRLGESIPTPKEQSENQGRTPKKVTGTDFEQVKQREPERHPEAKEVPQPEPAPKQKQPEQEIADWLIPVLIITVVVLAGAVILLLLRRGRLKTE